jgi:hypothetical protein
MTCCCCCWQGPITLSNYEARMEVSWVAQELEKARNIRPGFRWGGRLLLRCTVDTAQYCGGVAAVTLKSTARWHVSTQPASCA